MRAISFVVMVLAVAAMLLPQTERAEARRTVFWPKSGYCLSGKHVRNVKNCREFGGWR